MSQKLFSIISVTERIVQTRSSIFYYIADINIYPQNLRICNSGQYIYVTGLCNFFFVLQDLIDRLNSYFQRIVFQRKQLIIGFSHPTFLLMKIGSLHWKSLHKLERRNYGGKFLVNMKYQNLHSFIEGVILLCQSILEMRRISHLHGSALFTTPLSVVSF